VIILHLETSHVIPALIRKCLEAQEQGEKQVVLWGDGSPDPRVPVCRGCAEGLLLAAEHYNGAEPFNLGSGQEISIKDLAIFDRPALQVLPASWCGITSKPNGQPRRALGYPSRCRILRLSRPPRLSKKACDAPLSGIAGSAWHETNSVDSEAACRQGARAGDVYPPIQGLAALTSQELWQYP